VCTPPSRRAYVDESFHEAVTGGCYVLAAVLFSPTTHPRVREAMTRLRGARKIDKLHWTEMDARQRHTAAATVAGLGGVHVATVAAPVAPRRQERARAACLTRLVLELHEQQVTELIMEARTTVLDARDVTTVRGARFALPPGTLLHVRHTRGASEELCWAADIIAGAIRANREGHGGYRQLLGDCVTEIPLAT
jgi:hypothetical protein